MFLIIISGLFAITSLCVPLDAITLPHLHIHILAWSCKCITFCHFGATCFALSNVTVTLSWLITTTMFCLSVFHKFLPELSHCSNINKLLCLLLCDRLKIIFYHSSTTLKCYWLCWFLGAFAKLRRATISFMSVCPPVCPHGTTRLPMDGF